MALGALWFLPGPLCAGSPIKTQDLDIIKYCLRWVVTQGKDVPQMSKGEKT